MSEFQKASKEFVEWLRANDAIVSDNIEIKDYRSENAGRGIAATNNIKEGELLFSLPRKVLLSEETSQLAKIPKMKRILNTLDGWGPLILCLMYELKLENSFWKPYLDILPHMFTTPMFWDQKDLEELVGTGVIDKIGREDAETMFQETIQPIIKDNLDVFDETVHNLELFHTCGSLIMAYSFHDELTPKPKAQAALNEDSTANGEDNESEDEEDEDEHEEGIIAMVPMADMLNHRTGFNNARLFHEPDGLHMRAIKDIAAGEQIYNTYGELCNADLLRKYGFVDEPNELDIVEISGDMVRDICCMADDDKEAKVTFLLEEEVLDDCFVIEQNGELPPELLICAQVFTLSSTEFNTLLSKRKLPKLKMTEELREQMRSLITKRLEQYKTSMEEDEAWLKKKSSNEHAINAYHSVIVRLGEKRILHSALQRLEAEDGPKRKRQRK